MFAWFTTIDSQSWHYRFYKWYERNQFCDVEDFSKHSPWYYWGILALLLSEAVLFGSMGLFLALGLLYLVVALFLVLASPLVYGLTGNKFFHGLMVRYFVSIVGTGIAMVVGAVVLAYLLIKIVPIIDRRQARSTKLTIRE